MGQNQGTYAISSASLFNRHRQTDAGANLSSCRAVVRRGTQKGARVSTSEKDFRFVSVSPRPDTFSLVHFHDPGGLSHQLPISFAFAELGLC